MYKDRICVYTCITGDYDDLQPIYHEEGIDYICFTNNMYLKSDDWKIIHIEDHDGLGNMMLSREIKIVGHSFIRENYDISIWIDGAIQVRNSIKDFLEQYCHMNKSNMACFKHSVRDCMYEEAVACVIGRKENRERVIPWLDFMKREKFPEHFGLAECTVLIRRHNNELVNRTMQLWFELLKKYAKRDQLSFPYSIKKTGLEVQWIDLNVFENPWFFWKAHRQTEESQISRIMFGEYKDLYSGVYEDYELRGNGKKCELCMVIPITCNKMVINMGRHYGKKMNNFTINVSDAVVIVRSGIPIYNCQVFDYNDVVIEIKGSFSMGQEVKCTFDMMRSGEVEGQEVIDALVDKYYYDKRTSENAIRVLNQKCSLLSEHCNELERELVSYVDLSAPLFDKLRLLCEHQDLISRIIRKLILKMIH